MSDKVTMSDHRLIVFSVTGPTRVVTENRNSGKMVYMASPKTYLVVVLVSRLGVSRWLVATCHSPVVLGKL